MIYGTDDKTRFIARRRRIFKKINGLRWDDFLQYISLFFNRCLSTLFSPHVHWKSTTSIPVTSSKFW